MTVMNNVALSVGAIAVTIGAYFIARKLFLLSKQNPLLNPLLVASLIMGALLLAGGVDVEIYRQTVSPLALLIWPATAALALPLYLQFELIKTMGWRLVLPVVIAGTIAPLSAWLIVFALDGPLNLQMTVLVKSITTPLAMQTTQLIGGIPDLAAIIVILTGIAGATVAPFLFIAFGIKSSVVKGLSLGAIAHVVGTSSALGISQRCGAFASLALCLNGIVTSICLPLLFA